MPTTPAGAQAVGAQVFAWAMCAGTMRLLPRLPLRLGPMTVVAGVRGEYISPTVAREVDILVLLIPAGDVSLTLEICRLPRRARFVELPEVGA